MPRKITLTEEQIEKIIYLRETGSTLEETKLAVNTTYKSVRKAIANHKGIIRIKKLGIPKPYIKHSPYAHLLEEPKNQGKEYKAYVRDGK
jgi:hypothetical protein